MLVDSDVFPCCLTDDAFLRHPDYVQALLTCLQAIEQNKASLLADVSPALVSNAWLGLAWPGLAWPGLAWPGLAWPGLAWPGLAWPGLAWPGLAWPFAPI